MKNLLPTLGSAKQAFPKGLAFCVLMMGMMLSGVALRAQVISEDFEGSNWVTSAAFTSSTVQIGTSTQSSWIYSSAQIQSTFKNSGSKACTITNSSSSYLITPIITNGVASITLYAGSANSGQTEVAFASNLTAATVLANRNTNVGGIWTGVSTITAGAAFAQFTVNASVLGTNSGLPLYVRFRRISTGVPTIDDIVITSPASYYYGPSLTTDVTSTNAWWATADGTGLGISGSHPTAVSDANTTFRIQNSTSAPTMSANLTLGAGSKIVVGGGSSAAAFSLPSAFTLAGTIDVASNGTLNNSNTSGTNPTYGSLASTSTVNFNGSSAQTIQAATYGNLTLNNSAGATLGGAITTAGTLTITSGALSASTFTITANGNWVNNGTYTKGTGNVIFGGTTTISGASTNSFNALTINASSTLTAPSSGTINVSGAWTDNGTFVPNGSTVVFNGTTSTAGGANITNFFNLTVNPASTFTTDGINIAGNLLNNGSFSVTANAVTFNGTANQTVSGTGGTTNFGASSSLVVNNTGLFPTNDIVEISTSNFTASAGFINATTGLTAGILKISGSYTLSQTYFSAAGYSIGSGAGLWLNNANATLTGQAATPQLTGYLRITSGTVNVGISNNSFQWNNGSTFIMEGGAMNVAARFGPNSATTANVSTSFTMSGGTLTTAMGSATTPNGSSTVASFDIPANTGSTSSFTMSGGTIIVQKVASGIDFRMSALGTVNITGGTVQFGNASTTGSPNYQVGAASGATNVFPSLTINATGTPTATLNTAAVIRGDVTIATGTTLNANSKNINITGNTAQTGSWSNSGTYTPGTNVVTFDGTGAQSITKTGGETFNGFTVNKASGTLTQASAITITGNATITAGTLNSNGNNITLSGATSSWTNGGTYTPGANTVTFSGTGAQGYTRTGTGSFNNLTVNKSAGTITLNNSLTAGNNVTITAGTLNANNNNINVGGNWSNSGTFTPGTNLVTFNGSGAQQYSRTGTGNFYNLTLNNSTGLTLNNALTVSNTLTLTAGHITLGANNLSITSANAIASANSSNYVITDGFGQIVHAFTSGAYDFPVGFNAAKYAPVTITNTGGVSQTYSVRVVTPTNYSIFNDAANFDWFIGTGGGTSQSTLAFSWLTADANTNLAAAPGSGITYQQDVSQGGSTVAATPNVTTVTGITNFTNTRWNVAIPPATPPTVTTNTVSSITNSSAVSGGNVTSEGSSPVTARGVKYGTSSPATTFTTTDGSGGGVFVSNLTSLSPNTKYFYRAYATSYVTSFGTELNFTTLPDAPVVGVGDNQTAVGFTAHWTAPVVPGSEVYTFTVEADDDNLFGSVNETHSGISSGTLSQVFSALDPGVTYYYRVKAVNTTGSSAWSSTSAGVTTTSSTAPTGVVTGTVSLINVGGATISTNSIATDGGSDLTARGLAYNTSSPASGVGVTLVPEGGTAIGNFNQTLSGLSANTLYYVQAYATNSVGTTFGISEKNFTTLAVEPTTASSVTFGTRTNTTEVVNFSGGDGTRRIVIARLGSAVSIAPVDGFSPTGVNSDFSVAADQGSGNKIVYDGTGSTVTVTGLAQNSTYYYAVYEYNNNSASSPNYYATPGTGNETTYNPTVVATGSLSFGNQVVSTSSASQSYNVSGTQLVSGITVTPSTNYEISTDNITFGTSAIVLPKDGGDAVASTPVYVRFSPLAADGAHIGNISNTATAATTQNVAVSGNALAVEPTTEGSISIGAFTATSIEVNLPSVGNGNNRIIVIRAGSAVSFSPTDGTPISGTVSSDFGTATDQGSGNKVVYNGSGSGSVVTVTGLSGATTYYFAVYEYNVGTGSSQNYLTPSTVTASQLTPAASSPSDAYRTSSTATPGDWNNTSTWESFTGGNWMAATLTPTSAASTITIQTGHTVNVTVAVTIDETTIQTGGQVNINSGQTLTLNNGSGTDLTVNGYLKNTGTLTTTGAAVTVSGSTATYEHNQNNVTIPANITWASNSTLRLTGTFTGAGTGGANLGGLTAGNYQNIVWAAAINLGATTDIDFVTLGDNAVTIAGKLTASGTGNGALLTSAGGTNTLTVAEYEQTSGTVFINRGGGGTRGLTVTGNVTVSGGSLYIKTSGNASVGQLTVGGNFTSVGGTISNTGTSSGTLANIVFNSATPQTAAFGTVTSTTYGFGISVTGAGGVTLNSNLTLPNTGNITLTNGNFTIASGNTLTLGGTTTGSIASGRTLTVDGVLNRVSSGTFTTTGTLSVSNGGKYQHGHNAGTIPTATWVGGSTAEITGVVGNQPAAGLGQTFSNFIWNSPGQNTTINLTNALTTVNGDLTISNTGSAVNGLRLTSSTGTINVGGSLIVSGAIGNQVLDLGTNATPTIVIGADVVIGTNGTLKAGATSIIRLAGNWSNSGIFTNSNTTVQFNGTGAQSITKTGGEAFNNLTINNTGVGVTLANNASVAATLTFTNGLLNTGANTLTISSATAVAGAGAGKYVNGNLAFSGLTASPTRIFTVGDASIYAPITVTYTSALTTGGTLTASTSAGDHAQIGTSSIDPANSVNRTWTLTPSGGLAGGAYSAIFNFDAADKDLGFAFATAIIGRYNAGWTYPTTGTLASTSSQATGLTTFGDFQIGNQNQAIANFRSAASGNFGTNATWEYQTIGGGWAAATSVPGVGNNVIIRNSHTVTQDIDFTVGSGKTFDLQATSAYLINPGKVFTVAGTADFAGQNVTVVSDATGTGSIGQVTGTLSNATAVTVERFIPSTAGRVWRFVTSPVTGSQTIRQAWADGKAANGNAPSGENSNNRGTLLTGSGFSSAALATAQGFDWWLAIKNTASGVRRYNGALSGSWPTASSNAGGSYAKSVPSLTLTEAAAERGFMLFVRGDRSVTSATPNDTRLAPKGTLRVGDQNIAINNTDTFQILGNPYASAIDFASLYGHNTAVLEQFWRWDANNGSNGAYVFVHKIAGNWLSTPTDEGATNVTHIQSGQPVLVRPLSSGPVLLAGTLTVSESDKSNPSSVPSVFSPAPVTASLFSADLQLDNGAAGLRNADGVLAAFSSSYSPASTDADDVAKANNFNENMALVRNNRRMTVEALPELAAGEVLSISLTNLTARNYAFRFKATNLTTGLVATLEDAYLRTSTPVSLNGDFNTANFSVTADAASSASDRFKVVFKEDGSLPVALTAKAYQAGSSVQVDWKTVNEQKVKSFDVEKSVNGTSFTKAANVKATGTASNSYGWLDAAPVKGANYYRIKSIGTDGKAAYSQAMKVEIGGKKAGFAVYPNPVKTGVVTVQLSNLAKGTYTLVMHDAAGHKVMSQVIEHNGGSATETLTLSSSLAAGMYKMSIGDMVQTVVIDK